jgi:hypothetical protein
VLVHFANEGLRQGAAETYEQFLDERPGDAGSSTTSPALRAAWGRRESALKHLRECV